MIQNKRGEKMNISNLIKLAAFFSSVLLLSITNSYASDSNWHVDTKSYRVYLGVVPASVIKNDPVLIDREKSLHGGTHNTSSTSQHVMVSIFTKDGNKRVLNATAVAKVRNKKYISGTNIEKPLEKMLTSGTVTYGNYFDLPKNGKYDIEIAIYQSNKNGSEKAKFKFKKY